MHKSLPCNLAQIEFRHTARKKINSALQSEERLNTLCAAH